MNEEIKEKEVIDIKPEDVFDESTIRVKINKTMRKYYIERNLSIITFLLTIVLYVILSTTINIKYGHYSLSGWGFWWILFLEVPLIAQMFSAIKRKNLNAFPIFSLSLLVFLMLGLFLGRWHPGWLVFLAVPIYHSLASTITLKRLNKNLH